MVPFQQKLLDAQLVFNTAFQTGVESLKEGVDLVWDFKTEVINQPGVEETVLGWLAEMPLFRKWIGEREPKRVTTGSFSVKVEDYEFSFAVGRNDIKFDKYGLLTPVFRGAGVAQKRFWPDLITAVQAAGKTSLCPDGQFFYDTDHPNGFGQLTTSTYQNLWTAMTLNVANVATRYAYMTNLIDGNGKKLGIRPNIIEYGPAQFAAIRTIFEADIISEAISSAGVFGGTSGVVGAAPRSNTAMRGLLTPIMNPELESGVWYLHDTRVMKPFILMNETAPTGLITRNDPMDPHVWDFKEFLFGSDATAAASYGMPQLSTRCEE
jgi:phage major head subunit gpT-like protein